MIKTFILSVFCSALANGIVKDIIKLKQPRVKQKIRNRILHLIDPVIKVFVGNKKLKMLLSQQTPYYYASFLEYDRALPRICELIYNVDNNLFIIDIGANIGDTATLISDKISGASILCIEGDQKFLPFLYYNTKKINNNVIYIEPKYCVDTLENNKLNVENKNGTANLYTSENNVIENIDSLDNIINKNIQFRKANLLKIDTDGFEITLLKGAKKLLEQKHPLIFFEFFPEGYISNNQNPIDLIVLLNSYGYNKALFYDNFGNIKGIYNFTDIEEIKKNINEIDNNKIYYYDVLCVHRTDEEKYMYILKNEMERKNSI